jgi:Zn-dependent protease with chaperone function
VQVQFVDGRFARVHPAELTIAGDIVVVTGDTFERCAPLASVEITDAIGSAPRLVRFPDGGCCEPIDPPAFADALAAQGIGRSRLSAWEQSPRGIVVSLFTLVVVATMAYRLALPAMARVVANRLPDAAVTRLSRHTLGALDRTVFRPSDLPTERKAAILLAFTKLQFPPATRRVNYEIQFRKAPAIGPNALALPSGTIVVLDELIALAADDSEIQAVLAHEAGHVVYRHAQRLVLQNSAIALVITFVIGDMTAVAAAAPTALLQAKYSRDFEREADDYAARVLNRSGISTSHLAAILERLEATKKSEGGSSALDYLSTHPATAERLARLRAR